jgi:hypothetical protein
VRGIGTITSSGRCARPEICPMDWCEREQYSPHRGCPSCFEAVRQLGQTNCQPKASIKKDDDDLTPYERWKQKIFKVAESEDKFERFIKGFFLGGGEGREL